jgi:hypothetical protein
VSESAFRAGEGTSEVPAREVGSDHGNFAESRECEAGAPDDRTVTGTTLPINPSVAKGATVPRVWRHSHFGRNPGTPQAFNMARSCLSPVVSKP